MTQRQDASEPRGRQEWRRRVSAGQPPFASAVFEAARQIPVPVRGCGRWRSDWPSEIRGDMRLHARRAMRTAALALGVPVPAAIRMAQSGAIEPSR
jgi:hypothetical protein